MAIVVLIRGMNNEAWEVNSFMVDIEDVMMFALSALGSWFARVLIEMIKIILNQTKEKLDTIKILVLGGGPNRIGQGIEFDYCCVHAALAMRDDGYETIMVNCNPETVSTDYDTSDRLFFEPVTLEDVLVYFSKKKTKKTK